MQQQTETDITQNPAWRAAYHSYYREFLKSEHTHCPSCGQLHTMDLYYTDDDQFKADGWCVTCSYKECVRYVPPLDPNWQPYIPVSHPNRIYIHKRLSLRIFFMSIGFKLSRFFENLTSDPCYLVIENDQVEYTSYLTKSADDLKDFNCFEVLSAKVYS